MKITPFSPNREFISDQLARAKHYHCPVTLVYEFDLTDTLSALERTGTSGARVGLTALLVKATGLLLERHPRLNRHVFHRWFRRVEATFDEISCTLIVRREGPGGEEVLFPLLIRDPNRLSLVDIERIIRHHKSEDLGRLPQMAAFRRVQRMSWFARKYFSHRARSDPRFYGRYFGSYGISSNVARDWGPVSGGGGVANTAIAFVPGVIRDVPLAIAGEVRVRRVLSMGVIADHFVVDGSDVARAMVELRPLLESPVLVDGA